MILTGQGPPTDSITGICFKLCSDGPLISWKSKKQSTVALSTCEAEYVAMAAAVQEAKFLKQLFSDMQQCEQKKLLCLLIIKGQLHWLKILYNINVVNI